MTSAPDTAASALNTKPVPIQPAQPVTPEKIITPVKMPDSLGILTMKKGRTLWRTINNIYGEVNSEIVGKVNKANPKINNKNAITVGQNINLPSIPANVHPFQDGGFIVILQKGNNIKEMYDFFHENTYNQILPPILFFPFWNSKEGMIFAVILDKKFNSTEIAREAINKLPASIAAKAQIISKWDEESVFFNRQALKN
jgi:hypothetical protein